MPYKWALLRGPYCTRFQTAAFLIKQVSDRSFCTPGLLSTLPLYYAIPTGFGWCIEAPIQVAHPMRLPHPFATDFKVLSPKPGSEWSCSEQARFRKRWSIFLNILSLTTIINDFRLIIKTSAQRPGRSCWNCPRERVLRISGKFGLQVIVKYISERSNVLEVKILSCIFWRMYETRPVNIDWTEAMISDNTASDSSFGPPKPPSSSQSAA